MMIIILLDMNQQERDILHIIFITPNIPQYLIIKTMNVKVLLLFQNASLNQYLMEKILRLQG